MNVHPEIRRIILQFEAKELHAARSGRAIMAALAAAIDASPAPNLAALGEDLDLNVAALLEATPAYAPPLNVIQQILDRYAQAVDRQESVGEFKQSILQKAEAYQAWAAQAREKIATYGAAVIPEGGSLFTFTFSETVFRTLSAAWSWGRHFQVLVTESRPNNDGRATARSLADAGIQVMIGCDGNIAELIPQADVMLIGAEAILSDGSAICKTGTHPATLIAHRFGIPVYVLVDSMKLHTVSLFGKHPVLDPIQVRDIYPHGQTQAAVCGALFDKTPPELITALITERGLIHPNQVSLSMLQMPVSEAVAARIST